MEQRPASAAEEICPSDTLDRPNKDRRRARLSLEDFSNAGNTLFLWLYSFIVSACFCILECVSIILLGKDYRANW